MTPSAEKARRIEIAEHQIGVCDGRRVAAGAIAGGTRNRTSTLRANMQNAAGIDSRDRVAASADAGDFEAVERYRVAGDPTARRNARLTCDDQRDVGAGPAHIKRDQIGFPEKAHRIGAAGNAPSRT